MAVKVGMVSLGCPKNLVDSEIMLGIMRQCGYSITPRKHEADVLVVNTCAFINDAKEESIEAIFEMAQQKKKGKCRALIVAGCLAQRYPQELMLEIPEIDGLVGTGQIKSIGKVVQMVLRGEKVKMVGSPGFLPDAGIKRLRVTNRYSAYLKIAEGCNNRCSYCVIPSIRGVYRSRRLEDVNAEAKITVGEGVKELILVAQDTTYYGKDIYGKPSLPLLLKKLAGIKNLVWLRFMYAYPSLIDDSLIEVMASERKICRYIDMPLQHASKAVLKRMNRLFGRDEALLLINKLRCAVPEIAVRTTFIVGFPGETNEDFNELLSFLEEVRFERVGIFMYSAEEGTPAASMPGQVPEEIKFERWQRAMELQKKISLENNKKKIGKIIEVLVEGKKPGEQGIYLGRSEWDSPEIDGVVSIASPKDLKPGELIKVRVSGASEYDLSGVLAE